LIDRTIALLKFLENRRSLFGDLIDGAIALLLL
jgi:hypothetical protein